MRVILIRDGQLVDPPEIVEHKDASRSFTAVAGSFAVTGSFLNSQSAVGNCQRGVLVNGEAELPEKPKRLKQPSLQPGRLPRRRRVGVAKEETGHDVFRLAFGFPVPYSRIIDGPS